MNILITGASRGIGAAALDAAQVGRPPGRRPFDAGQRRADRRRPRRPGARRATSGTPRSTSSAGASTCWSTMPASTKPSPTMRRDDEWHAAWARTLTDQPAGRRPTCAGSPCRISSTAGRRADRQRRQPRRLSRRFARSTGIMPRPRARMVAMTRTIARGYAAEGILVLRGRARLHRVGNDRGISRRPRRRADRRRHPARPGRQHRRDRRDHPLAGDRRAGRRHRHRSSTPMEPAMFASLRRRRARSPPSGAARPCAEWHDAPAHGKDGLERRRRRRSGSTATPIMSAPAASPRS